MKRRRNLAPAQGRETAAEVSSRSIDLLVIGEINPDIIVADANPVPVFGQVEKLVESIRLCVGSSSVITACGAARLGLQTAFVGVLGDDVFGNFMLAAMAKQGIDTSGCIVDCSLPTGATVILDKGDDRAMLTSLGAIGTMDTERVPARLIQKARHLHVGSYFLQSAARPHLPILLASARDQGLSTSFDCNWDPEERWEGIEEMLPATDVFFLNGQEARRITGVNDEEEAALALALKPLRSDRWPVDAHRVVTVKLGRRGALVASNGNVLRAVAREMEVVDTTGAGDSFNAGFLYGWLTGWDLKTSLNLAVVCGSLSTRAWGGTEAQPSLAEALEHLIGS